MTETQVIFKMKEYVLDHMGEIIYEPTRLEATAESLEGKTAFEIKKMSPVLDYGTLILRILATSLKPKDSEDAAKIFVFITAVRNKYETEKAQWYVDEKDIKELKDYFKKAEGPLLSPMMIGQITEKFSDLELDLKAMSKKKSSKQEE